jgi:protein O-GlcNAc transferase
MPTIAELFEEAVVFFRSGDWLRAEKLFRQILHIDPHNVEVLHLLGITINKAGRPDAGIPLLQEAITRNPAIAAYHANLGIALEMQGQLTDAAECFRQALRLDPNYINARFNLGKVLFKTGNISDAAECFLHALRLNPKDAVAHFNLGNVYLRGAGELPKQRIGIGKDWQSTRQMWMRIIA